MDITIYRERRKSFKLSIENGGVVLKAPWFVRKSEIEGFIQNHRLWIEKAKERQKRAHRDFVFGERFLYLGQWYELCPGDGDLHFDQSKFLAKNPTKELFQRFYKNEAKKVVCKMVEESARRWKDRYERCRITSAKRRWGSCSSKKNLNFTYRLVLLPLDLIEYVVIHELCHLTHMNHSASFWRLVETRMPDFRQREKRLREFLLHNI